MKNIRLMLLAWVVCLSMTSCFDMIEEVDMKPNGAGTIKATLNLSKSKTKVASLMKLDKVEGMKVPSQAEIRKEMNTVIGLLRQTPGITNVQHTLDFSNFIATISCDFKDVGALNTFAQTLSKHFKVNVYGHSSYWFDIKSKTFVRKHTHSAEAKKEFDKLSAEGKKSFQDAFYTGIYRFQHEVRATGNPQAKTSANKRAVMLRTTVPDLIEGKSNLSNKITIHE